MDQTPVVYNIPDQIRGDTWNGINSIVITKNGSPINLLSGTVVIQFRKHLDSPVALELSTLSNPQTIVITSPADGTIQVPPLVIDVIPGTYIYDMQVTYYEQNSNVSTVKTYMKGSWNILPDVTR